MGRHALMCDNCKLRPAELEDREPPAGHRYWCRACAFDLIKAGDPIVDFREFDEGDAYANMLRDHGTLLHFLSRTPAATRMSRSGPRACGACEGTGLVVDAGLGGSGVQTMPCPHCTRP